MPLRYILASVLLYATCGVRAAVDNLPPPLPEDKWVGKTNLNYTTLHEDYGHLLICLYLPLGLIGFYLWLAVVFMDIFSFIQLIRYKGRSAKTLITGCLSALFSVFLVAQHAKSLHDCGNRFTGIQASLIPDLIASACSLLGGLIIALLGDEHDRIVASSYTLFCVALLIHQFTGAIYFSVALRVMMKSLGLTEVQDKVMGELNGAAYIPLVFVYVATMWWVIHKRHIFGGACALVFLILGVQILMFFWLMGATGYVLLGKIVGDPWGVYTLRRWIGAVDVVLLGVVPGIEGLLLF